MGFIASLYSDTCLYHSHGQVGGEDRMVFLDTRTLHMLTFPEALTTGAGTAHPQHLDFSS